MTKVKQSWYLPIKVKKKEWNQDNYHLRVAATRQRPLLGAGAGGMEQVGQSWCDGAAPADGSS